MSENQVFETGAQRNSPIGKGAPHLIPPEAMNKVLLGIKSENLAEILLWKFLENKNYSLLPYVFFLIFSDSKLDYFPFMKQLAAHYEKGAAKFGENNWRLGQPLPRLFDSAMRHVWAIYAGEVDEDHVSAAAWNILAIIQTKIDIDKGILPKTLDFN
jgi:hypothetical protein